MTEDLRQLAYAYTDGTAAFGELWDAASAAEWDRDHHEDEDDGFAGELFALLAEWIEVSDREPLRLEVRRLLRNVFTELEPTPTLTPVITTSATYATCVTGPVMMPPPVGART